MTTCIDATATERSLRKSWAAAAILELVNRGRAAGWLDGAPCETDAAARLLRKLEIRELTATPMAHLQRAFALAPVEMHVLWLLALVELDPQVSALASALVSAGQHQLNAMVVEQLASGDDGECDGGTLDRLVELGLVEGEWQPSTPLYRRTLRVHDRVLDLVRGSLGLDREIAKWASLVAASPARADVVVPAALAHALAARDAFVVAAGQEGSGRQTLLRAAAGRAGAALLVVRSAALASEPAALVRQLRALRRECTLHGAWPLLLEADALADRVAVIARELFEAVSGPVLATARESLAWSVTRPLVSVVVEVPAHAQRAALWQQALGTAADGEVVEACTQRYTVGPGMIERAATAAVVMAGGGARVELEHVHLALRAQLERKLLGLATRIETAQRWRDLVMPNDQLELLAELVARVKHRKQVLETWGFQQRVGKGTGISVLLSGPPGTGKTMVAGLVAQELGLDLYQVDLSKIVSKYIGETEKQLAQLFDAAESGHSILLFDEADSMFGKRTEVKSSNDRYANLEVNYLLQRMEAFSGITLLTTNHESSIDPAFHRRLAMHVRVPMPDDAHRAQLWQSMLPEAAPVQGALDFAQLADDFVMSGGYIKNAVLRAAYLAADDGSPITQAHLLRAAHAEYESMGKVTQRTR